MCTYVVSVECKNPCCYTGHYHTYHTKLNAPFSLYIIACKYTHCIHVRMYIYLSCHLMKILLLYISLLSRTVITHGDSYWCVCVLRRNFHSKWSHSTITESFIHFTKWLNLSGKWILRYSKWSAPSFT